MLSTNGTPGKVSFYSKGGSHWKWRLPAEKSAKPGSDGAAHPGIEDPKDKKNVWYITHYMKVDTAGYMSGKLDPKLDLSNVENSFSLWTQVGRGQVLRWPLSRASDTMAATQKCIKSRGQNTHLSRARVKLATTPSVAPTLDFREVSGDGQCPSGFSLVTAQEANANNKKAVVLYTCKYCSVWI